MGETIQRSPDEVLIKEDLQDFLNFARYKELTADFKVDQKEVDKLAEQINAKWWAKNKSKLVK